MNKTHEEYHQKTQIIKKYACKIGICNMTILPGIYENQRVTIGIVGAKDGIGNKKYIGTNLKHGGREKSA